MLEGGYSKEQSQVPNGLWPVHVNRDNGQKSFMPMCRRRLLMSRFSANGNLSWVAHQSHLSEEKGYNEAMPGGAVFCPRRMSKNNLIVMIIRVFSAFVQTFTFELKQFPENLRQLNTRHRSDTMIALNKIGDE